ncbi:MAG: Crp/Fnr family transcriptional regulator [Candidatus Eremiobacteraeota bacterium]|nr:Crp/Fnr family transcriptional regulator [Candidatus Eremiobacteraeota bacterium]
MEVREYRGGRENLLIGRLTASERERLDPLLRPVGLEPRQVLARHREPIAHVYFPVDAVTSTLMELPDGESIEVGLMGAEGVTGLSLLYREALSNTTVVTQIPGRALCIEADAFVREVVDYGGEFYFLLLRYANVFMEMIAQVAACNASHSVEQRCARWILLAHDRVGRDRFPLTHEFLAIMLGVRRASVTGAASGMRAAGAIEYERGEVHVLDRDKLEVFSCSCYVALVRAMGWLLPEPAK